MSFYPKVTILGVGLMGGSIGLALRQRGLAEEIVGIGRRQASLDKALACGVISHATLDLEAGVRQADLVIICTPVAAIVDDVRRVLAATESPGVHSKTTRTETLVTDIGSTKSAICLQTTSTEGVQRFVGSHPLAGDHRSGPDNALADLFVKKTVVLTPTASTATETTSNIQEFWQALGAKVVQMAPAEHDQALASTSHLPHLVASALAATTPEKWLSLAATGWSATTRIAAGDPELWAQIFAQNTPDLLAALDRLIAELGKMRASLATEDWKQTQDSLTRAKRIRDALGN